MKKDVKLYNMILPPFMLFFFVPTLWIVSALGNFIIDSIVLLIISEKDEYFNIFLNFIYKKFTWQLYKKSIIPVFLFGFLSDFLGVLYLMAISIGSGAKYYEGNDIGKQILSGIYLATNHSCYDSIYGVLFIVSGILFSSIFIFAFNYRVSFNNKGLSKKQKIIASLTMAIITAPYTFLLPKELFYP